MTAPSPRPLTIETPEGRRLAYHCGCPSWLLSPSGGMGPALIAVERTHWYYTIENDDPVGPFLTPIDAGDACRDALIARAEGRTPLGRIEQDIAAIDLTAAAASISISLRRVADALEESTRLMMIVADKLESIEMSVR